MYTISSENWQHVTTHSLEWAEMLAIAVSMLMKWAEISTKDFTARFENGRLIVASGKYLHK